MADLSGFARERPVLDFQAWDLANRRKSFSPEPAIRFNVLEHPRPEGQGAGPRLQLDMDQGH
jgi:hypothetical protein